MRGGDATDAAFGLFCGWLLLGLATCDRPDDRLGLVNEADPLVPVWKGCDTCTLAGRSSNMLDAGPDDRPFNVPVLISEPSGLRQVLQL